MFEDENDRSPDEDAADPIVRAKDRFDQFRMHAELVAVLEGHRKFDAQIDSSFDGTIAREVQKSIARLEKAKTPDSPVLPPTAADEAAALLKFPESRKLSTNDYYIHRRPGEVMIVRWLAGEQVDSFYERLQAHFDAALNQYREEERQSNEWKQDPDTLKYLEALGKLDVRMADRYLREIIKQHNVFVLSTQTADEADILHLCDYVMGVDVRQIVGAASAPPEDGATERDRAWFYKLFSLRGIDEGVERMCFFLYLQKTEDTFEDSW